MQKDNERRKLVKRKKRWMSDEGELYVFGTHSYCTAVVLAYELNSEATFTSTLSEHHVHSVLA